LLVLSRKLEESIMIGDEIEIKIIAVHGETVKLGITAPRSIPVHRKEVYQEIEKENILAATTGALIGKIDLSKHILRSPESKEKKTASDKIRIE
jgi:carbon storage regulator